MKIKLKYKRYGFFGAILMVATVIAIIIFPGAWKTDTIAIVVATLYGWGYLFDTTISFKNKIIQDDNFFIPVRDPYVPEMVITDAMIIEQQNLIQRTIARMRGNRNTKRTLQIEKPKEFTLPAKPVTHDAHGNVIEFIEDFQVITRPDEFLFTAPIGERDAIERLRRQIELNTQLQREVDRRRFQEEQSNRLLI
jgi:hypothetical protein